MVQGSYTILTSAIIFLVCLIFFIMGLVKKNKAIWISALILGLVSGGYVSFWMLVSLSGGM